MRNLKKVLSLVLCVAVMLSVMVMGAGAAFSDQDKIENTEAVDACSALNILVGYEDGSFHPERNIKRSEVTKMICVALNGGKEPNVSSNAKPTFKDVRGTIHAWAEGYIESCVAQGIVDGVGGDRFAPAGNVTGAQLAKMLLVSLGYKAENEGFTGNAWETNVNVRATQKHLYDGLEKMDTSAAVTRDQASQMVWNAMQAYEVEYKTNIVTDANGNLVTQVVVQDKVVGDNKDKITLLRDKYDAWVYVGTLTSVNSTDIIITMNAADRDASDPKVDSKVTSKKFSKLGKDYSALMGQKVKVLFKDGKTNEVIGVYATSDNAVYTTVANGTEKDDNKVKFDGKSYSVETNDKGEILTYVDGEPANGTTLDELNHNTFNPNMYTFVDTDGNGKLDALIVKTYNVAQVTYAGSDKIIAAGKTYKTADENVAEGLKKDDWVVITRNLFQDKFDIVKAEVQKETLTALRDKKKDNSFFDNGAVSKNETEYSQYQIGETWYNGAAAVQSDRSKADLNTVKAGDSVEYVAVNGITFYMKKSTGSNTGRVDNVALIMAADTTGVEDRVKIALFDGTEKTVAVDKDSTVKFNALKANLGTVYEYSVSGDKYSFEDLKQDKDYYGDLTFRGKDKKLTAEVKAELTNDKFDKLKIDDNAQVLLYNPTTKKVADLTGKQFNALDLNNINGKGKGGTVVDNSPVYGFSGDMSGLDRIGALAVQVSADTDLDNLSNQSWNHYGFITEDAKWITRNKTLTFKMWNGTEEITVQEDHNTLSDRTARTVIGYNTLNAKDNVNWIDDVDAMVKDKGAKLSAITKVSTDKKTISVIGAGDLDISNATILYVNSDDKTGQKDGSINEADKTADGKKYLANVLYAGLTEDEPDLVVIEQGRWFKSDAHKGDLVSDEHLIYGDKENTDPIDPTPGTELKDPSKEQLTEALATGDVTATGVIPAGTYVSNNTLTLKNAVLTDKVVVTGNVALDGSVTLSSDGKLEVLGTLTINKDATIELSKLDKVTAKTVVDNRTQTTAADVDLMFKSDKVGATNVTVQDVNGVLATTDLSGKTITVTGAPDGSGGIKKDTGNVDLSTVTTSNAATVVDVKGTATLAAAANLNGTWKIGTLDGAGTSLTVSAGTTTIDKVRKDDTHDSGGTLATIADVKDGATLVIKDKDATVTTVTDNHGTLEVAGKVATLTANAGTLTVSAIPTTLTASTGKLIISGEVAAAGNVSTATKVTFKDKVSKKLTVAAGNELVFEKTIDLKAVFGDSIDGTNAGMKVTFKEAPTNLYVAAGTELTSETTEGAFVANGTVTPAITPVENTVYKLVDSTYNTDKAAFVAQPNS